MNYPVTGTTSIGTFVALNEADLIAMHHWLVDNGNASVADEVAKLFPEVFTVIHVVEMTQEQVDIVHLLLGYVSSKSAFELDRILEGLVSETAYERYDRVSWSANSEDGLDIKID